MPSAPNAVSNRLAGRVAVITGANRGMGRAIAQRFASEGANVFLLDSDGSNFAAIAKHAAEAGSEAAHRLTDVTRIAEVEAAFAEAEKRFNQIDILVTAAGIFQARSFLDYPLGDWQRIVDVNLTGTMLACQAALRRMVKRRYGRILTLSSAVGRSPGRFRTGYSATKHAVIGLTRCLALEFAAQGITANAICPGMIETEMYEEVVRQDGELSGERDYADAKRRLLLRSPQGRMIDPAEIAGLAAYLASAEAHSFTGQAVGLDGGMVMA